MQDGLAQRYIDISNEKRAYLEEEEEEKKLEEEEKRDLD